MYIFALTTLAQPADTHEAAQPVLDGDIRAATKQVQQRIDGPHAGSDAGLVSQWASLAGDLMLAQDRDEEAEEFYRRALRLAADAPRGQVRVVSCRNTGFLNLYQHRFGTAQACFRRVLDDADASDLQKVEAACALAVTSYNMGKPGAAFESLALAAQMAAKLVAEGGSPRLVMLTSVLHTDLCVQQAICTHAELQDHVYWHNAGPVTHSCEVSPQVLVEQGLQAYAAYPLIAQRLGHLRATLRAASGSAQDLQDCSDHVAWLRDNGLSSCERRARLEMALAALTVKDAETAHAILEPLRAQAGDALNQRWNFELDYCMSRICALQGRADESLRHYQRYALESVLCVRAESASVSQSAGQGGGQLPVKDDVEMSLPAKYRRAYRYLLEHLDSANLSVREIAEQVGVTERALQSVFKVHLGMTPVEVLRRCRVERIRHDLVEGSSAGRSIIDAAERWGIRNRSTLVAAYRKHFSETPAQTLARCGRALDRSASLAAA